MKNKYEDPTQRLVSHNWSEEYKKNHTDIFGVRYRLYFSDGTQKIMKYKNKDEALWAIHNEGDHVTGYIEL